MYKVWWFAELLPEQKILEENMLDIIRKNYKKYWYTPIETPSMEKTEVLVAKWWWEVKNQIFWVYWLAQWKEDLKDYSLRFDLTVPFSRYVLDYRWELTFPFKRSAIWKVWRWERQQRWRSKEFYQADIDVIWEENQNLVPASKSWDSKKYLFYDAEVMSVAYKTYLEIFKSFNLNTKIKININNRKIMSGFIKGLWLWDSLTQISLIIDKIEKVSEEKIREELHDIVEKYVISDEELQEVIRNYVLTGEGLHKIVTDSPLIWWEKWIKRITDQIIDFCKYKTNYENLKEIKNELKIENDEFDSWIRELRKVLSFALSLWVPEDAININFSIVRWLDYYTWTVFETFIDSDRSLGSIWSGWRYEKLTSYIDPKTNFSWVWFSIWVTRLEDYLFEKIDVKTLQKTTSDYLIINFEETHKQSFKLYNKLISKWKNVEFYPEPDKLQKQLKYADKKKIWNCIILWEDELKRKIYILKDMNSWESLEVKL